MKTQDNKREQALKKISDLRAELAEQQDMYLGLAKREFEDYLKDAINVLDSVGPDGKGRLLADRTVVKLLKEFGVNGAVKGAAKNGTSVKRVSNDQLFALFQAGKRYSQSELMELSGIKSSNVIKEKLDTLRAEKKIDFKKEGTSKLWFKV
jgi:hypothetical protein